MSVDTIYRRPRAASRTRGPFVSVALCVNDDRGMDVHRVRAVHVSNSTDFLDYIELESNYVSENDGDRVFPKSYGYADAHGKLVSVRVGRSVFRAWDHVPHVGNLYWDQVTMPRKEARRLVAYLIGRGWDVMGGPTESDLYPGGTYDSARAARPSDA